MEYNHEQYILNKICEFRNRETETEFMEYEKTVSFNIVRFLMLFMGLIFFLFAIPDFFNYGKGQLFYITAGLRVIILLVTIIAFFVLGSIKHYRHTLIMVTLVELIAFCVYLLILYIFKTSQPAPMMLFIFAAFLIPNVWKNCIAAGCIMLIGYIFLNVVFGLPKEVPPLNQRGIYLGICLLSFSIFTYSRENSRRKQFAAEKLLEFMSMTDRLTGIYNRSRFDYLLGQWIKNMRHDPFCMILFDIDNFKKVNDTCGHTAGDEVLAGTASVVAANIRDDDIFARWGGEEFVVLFGETGIERAAELAERLRKAVENNNCGEAGKITISIGVVQYRRGETVTGFIIRADEKMYEAKQAGKNRIMVEG
ncbi:MAG: GGDEF domain-containing protein [Treponema sp.]|nr:GGDEF domain-containing protein [Treponema sp.]